MENPDNLHGKPPAKDLGKRKQIGKDTIIGERKSDKRKALESFRKMKGQTSKSTSKISFK